MPTRRVFGSCASIGAAATALILAAAGWLSLHRQGEARAQSPALLTVIVASPLVRDVTQWDDYVGRFRASRSVDVRARVSGAVRQVLFVDGQIVHKGQLLFTIDDRRFRAAQAIALAEVASAQSRLNFASAELKRARGLTGDNALSTEELDKLKAEVRGAQAALDSARAQLRERDLDLNFTRVRAPISGRISDRRVDPGNLITGLEGSGGTLLTTIDAVDPMYFYFDASEALYLKRVREQRQNGAAPLAELRLQDETGYRWKGTLTFTDSAFSHSGTLRARVTVPNPSGLLRPGLIADLRLSAGTVRALLVPDAAVRTDEARQIVLVVDPSGMLVAKEVTVGALVDGLRIVLSGLHNTDRVLIEGSGSTAGDKVATQTGTITPDMRPLSAPVRSVPAPEATLSP